MATHFLTPHTMDLKGSSNTLSEVSETSTANSECTSGWGSREDISDLAMKIGLEDLSMLHEQQFRVDRRKLEHMIIGDHEALELADTFFHKIMKDTNTIINWPNRLKVGSNTKKDPQVRVAGRQEDVQTAKERILNILDTRANRITIKMDVSYTDHSHIIGKEGLTIKRVMEETLCHVHFPDSNRCNATEKSNQVSIAGDIDGAERARSRVRNLSPLIFCFELPFVNSNNSVIPNINTAYVNKVQQQYNVQVMFRTRPKLHGTLVMVKGSEWEIQQLKHATCLLMEFMCDNLSNQIPIQMCMEISPHHHAIVAGKNHANIKAIIQNTRTQIMFPDARDPNIPSLKKSNVVISGNIHNVYIARQQLMGSLPLAVIFDLPEGSEYILEPEKLANIQFDLDVTINIHHKAKRNIMACMIKGVERYATNIYEARNRVLGLKKPCIIADIPPSYFIPHIEPTCEATPAINVQLSSPIVSPPMWQPFNHATSFVGLVPQPQFMYNNILSNSLGTSGYGSLGQSSSSTASLDSSFEGSYSSMSSRSPVPSPLASPKAIRSPYYQAVAPNNSQVSEMPSVLPEGNRSSENRKTFTTLDIDQKRVAGIRAMQNRKVEGYRVPTNTWSGYGINYTSPSALRLSDQDENIWKQEEEAPASTNLKTSNILESTPASLINQITNAMCTDLPSMLTLLGLEKYVGLFTSHEIDLTIFPSLNEDNLIELGVTAFGARRKMMLIISEMNKRYGAFSAAPGAERRNTTTSHTNNSSFQNNWQ